MATRSRIAIENQNGTVTSIYCHNDGYIRHNGEILNSSYKDRSKVEELINLGDISILTTTIEKTYVYHRDRDEPFFQQENNSVESFFISISEAYGYCFTKEGIWLVSNGGPVIDLELAIKEGI